MTNRLMAALDIALMLAILLTGTAAAQDIDCWHYEDGDAPIVGSVGTLYDVSGVAIADTCAYVVDSGNSVVSGLVVIDITDPENPQIMGSVYIDWLDGRAVDIAVSGNYAYLVTSEQQFPWYVPSRLNVIEITNPESPEIEAIVNFWVGDANAVAISGSYAYVTGGVGLAVIDIDTTNPEGPHAVGWVHTEGFANDVAILGSYAYVADGDFGLKVIDMTDPENPYIRGSVDTPGSAVGVTISGTHAYVSDGASGLQLINIRNPNSPQIVGSVDTPGSAVEVAISGNYAYVADSGSGLLVIDITDPESPQTVGGVSPPNDARGVAVSGSHAYVAGGESGLQILPVQCEELTGVSPESLPTTTRLFPSYPNPFNPSTTIAFAVPEAAQISLRVYDLSGRLVRTLVDGEAMDAGRHETVWRGSDDAGRSVAAGVYLYRLDVGGYTESRRMVLVK